MRKNILKLTLGLAVVIAAGYTVYASQASVELVGVAMDNVEALADDEGGSKHTLECGNAGIKVCSATCNKCNVTLTSYGNGKTVTLTCYQ